MLYLISAIFRVRPHVFVNITSDIIQGDAPGIKPLGMSDQPLTILNCDVPAASIHGFKEGHLVMWLKSKPDWNQLCLPNLPNINQRCVNYLNVCLLSAEIYCFRTDIIAETEVFILYLRFGILFLLLWDGVC